MRADYPRSSPFKMFFVLTMILLPLLAYPMFSRVIVRGVGEPVPKETTVFQDGFENDSVGSFPSEGWSVVYDGRAMGDQQVVDSYHHNGSKSLQLWGQTGWSAVVERRIDFGITTMLVGYELSILLENRARAYADSLGFFRFRGEDYWGTLYGALTLDHSDGTIRSEQGTLLGDWQPNIWYRLKVIVDISNGTYSVWTDNPLKGERLSLRGQGLRIAYHHPELMDAITLVSGWPGVKVFYDDVRVFTVQMNLTGSSGISMKPLVDILALLVLATAALFLSVRLKRRRVISNPPGYLAFERSVVLRKPPSNSECSV